ncbi:MDR family MFS transporter [Aspergillus thermomutatus]|uniref:Major facilitator superfamily (MFS) profile domain-containing protein n=1 Tax=Aspergillus thermomutatus TaxID=41047 RepID=A0A397HL48_ASPTH|nr:uncharacterized protein CDV56_109059 [Aspergillus thermomutatus]RHZ63792.1 hypothetical protein CDV56_109059 [Aspergillus thermomutatus]
MSSPACSAADSATVIDQFDDVESTLSAPCEDRTLLDSTDETWVPPKGFLWVQIAIMSNVFLSGFDGTITASAYAVISSEFNAANTASWLTTSYLITSTAFQPLYGRFSNIFGRRVSFFTATITFVIGCLGCGVARDIVLLNMMRALTGIGGGGLMTMATIVNSDLIPFRRWDMYQALQNGMHGFGSICGVSFGGSIVDTIGWRWCFLVQVLFLFTLPLLFQVILLDMPTTAGARLAIPSLATPIGGLISGVVMSRWGRLAYLVRAGCLLMCIGNLLVMSIQFHDAGWKYLTYVIPASLGQGIVYPGILFTFLAAFDHTDHAVSASTVYLIRSLGTVWGVAITSTIIQNTLRSGLSKALSGIPDKQKVTPLKWSISET